MDHETFLEAEIKQLRAELGRGNNEAYQQGRTDERRAWAAHAAPLRDLEKGDPALAMAIGESEGPDLLIPLRQFLGDLPPGITITITRVISPNG